MFVGLYTFNTAPSGQKRIEPVITYDKPIRSKAAVDLIIQAFLKIELTDFWAEMYELPKDALKYLDVPRLVPEAAVRAAENVRE
jgi:hypothetical protein